MDIAVSLRTFLRVAQTGSFSAAALDLDLTQPAVSRQISALEAHLNVRLLHRSTSALALTAEGERMIPLALNVIAAVEALSDSTHPLGATFGKVRLSVPSPLGLYLSERIGALLGHHRDLSIELLLRDDSSELVEEGIDIEVRLGAVADRTLTCRRVGWTTAFLVAAPAYLEKHGAPATPEDLKQHDCISYRRGGDGRTWAFSRDSAEISVNISPRFILNNAIAAYHAVKSGSGIAIISHILADPDVRDVKLVHLLPNYTPIRLPINLTYPSQRNMPLRVRTVIDFLIREIRKDPLMA